MSKQTALKPSLETKPSLDTLFLAKRQKQASTWFRDLRDRICAAFEKIESEGTDPSIPVGSFKRKVWDRPGGGGGEMALMHGRVFEKVGVNISTVHGQFSKEFRANIPGAEDNDGNFWASGVSLVAHMRSPLVPAIHMNTRMIVTGKAWYGGGTDLNPMIEDERDTADFHAALKGCCDRHDTAYYPKFKQWCDDYFFIPHRNKARGVGGIFFDYLDSGDAAGDFKFVQDVGETFLSIYPEIIRRHMHESWTQEQREHQLVMRGHYAEFNLIYDRGTQFGLKTGGNPEAILMSLPPEAKWP
jgi:coproporphyrinogen III oxidase